MALGPAPALAAARVAAVASWHPKSWCCPRVMERAQKPLLYPLQTAHGCQTLRGLQWAGWPQLGQLLAPAVDTLPAKARYGSELYLEWQWYYEGGSVLLQLPLQVKRGLLAHAHQETAFHQPTTGAAML